VVGDTEIHATYPSLPAGTYPVHLQAGAAVIRFTETLVIVPPPGHPTASLSYPSAPQVLRGLVYDAERDALIAGLGFSTSSSNQIVRYQFSSGAWQAPATHADLRDLALSMNGSRLLAVSDGALAQVDPVTLALLSTTPKPPFSSDPSEYLKGIVVANDGNAVVTTGYKFGSGSTTLYLHAVATSTFSAPPVVNFFNVFYYGVAGTPANGATVAIFETGLTPAVPSFQYAAASGRLSRTGFQLEHFSPDISENINQPAFDAAGSRMMVASVPDSPVGPIVYGVYDATYARLGSLSSATTLAYAVAPGASRAYTFDVDDASGACHVRAFDLLKIATPLSEITSGFPIPLATCPAQRPAGPVRFLISPAGDTAFIAGNVGIAVVHLP